MKVKKKKCSYLVLEISLGESGLQTMKMAARVACGGDGDYAFEAAVVGIVDDLEVPGAPNSWTSAEAPAGGKA